MVTPQRTTVTSSRWVTVPSSPMAGLPYTKHRRGSEDKLATNFLMFTAFPWYFGHCKYLPASTRAHRLTSSRMTGELPYSQYRDNTVPSYELYANFVENICEQNKRPDITDCHREKFGPIAKIIERCWSTDRLARPRFSQLEGMLDDIIVRL